MTLTELRYIVALARERHFGRAAENCFVSQPTLSVAVKKLEDELGVALFERRPSEVELTPIGQRIVDQAMRVLEEVKKVKILSQEGRDQLSTPLRVGAIHTVGPYVFPRLVAEIRPVAPKMPLIIEENFTARLADALKKGALDAILVSEPFQEAGIVSAPLYDEDFVLALPAGHAWTRRTEIDAGDLAHENTLLLSAGNCFRDQVLKVCPDLNRSGGGDLQKTLEGGSLQTISYMVATGVGITVLPCSAVSPTQPNPELVVLRPFRMPAPYRRIVLAWRAQFPREKAITALRTALRRCPLPCVRWLYG